MRAGHCHKGSTDSLFFHNPIQKLHALKVTVGELELLEKLSFDSEHWWVLVPIEHESLCE
jgi:hypothetical protein